MKIRILLFAAAREAAGASQLEVELPVDATAQQARTALCEALPALRAFGPRLMLAVNGKFAADTDSLAASDEVACIPPVSGG